MAKKRRQAKPKVDLSDNEGKQLPAKRPRRGAARITRDNSPMQVVNHGNGDVVTETVLGNVSPSPDVKELETAVLSVVEEAEHEVPSEINVAESTVMDRDEVSDAASDSSDSSSDSDSSSSSDSDSSDSDSKSGTCEPTPVEPVTETLMNSVTNHPLLITSYPVKEKSSSSDSYHSDTEEEDKKRRKKQKSMQRQLLAKRSRRAANNRGSRSDAMEDDEDDIGANCDDVPDWPEEDFGELLKRIEEQLPPKDNLKFDSRAAKLDWGRVRFNDYTTDECYDVWTRISKRIRRFRNLSEMLVDARDWISKPWTNFYRGTKKNRHPDMPPRPLSTYMIYYLEQKDRVSSVNPGLEMTQISKIISEQYKGLANDEKDKYTDMAAKERQNFEEKLSDFYKDHPDMVPHQQSKPNWREAHAKGPRKPSAPFKLFYQDQLKRLGETGIYDRKSIEEMSKESWRAMNDKKKLVWITWSLEDLKRYEEELQKYQREHPDFVPPVAAKNVLNKDERAIKERLAGKPLKPPNSAYSYFSRVMLQSDEEVKSIPPKLRMAEISRKWKEISDAQKTKYEETVRELQEQYKLEFASYLEGLSKEEREAELKKTMPKRKTPSAKVELDTASTPAVTPALPRRRQPARRSARRPAPAPVQAPSHLQLFKGEPPPPPVRAFDLFVQNFVAERPSGLSETQRQKEAPHYWEVLSEAKKEFYQTKLVELKSAYIKDYEIFLKGLSPEEIKEFRVLKKKAGNDQKHGSGGNGTLSDSEDSGKDNVSSDSEDSDEEGNVSDESKSSSSQFYV